MRTGIRRSKLAAPAPVCARYGDAGTMDPSAPLWRGSYRHLWLIWAELAAVEPDEDLFALMAADCPYCATPLR